MKSSERFDGNRYGVRVFLVMDTHEVELPSHTCAVDNLDMRNHKLRVERIVEKSS